MNELQVWKFEGKKEVRTVARGADAWFVAKDVCDVLEIGNSRQALSRLEDNEKGVITNDTPGGSQQMSIVNESGMYNLAFSSRKPAAIAFRQWVTSEVIPSIRKTGTYSVVRLSQAELIVKMAEQNLTYENKLIAHDDRITALERNATSVKEPICGVVIEPVLAIELKPIEVKPVTTKSVKTVDLSEYVSMKDFLDNLGIVVPDGVPQGLGRSARKLCELEGIEIKTKPASAKSRIAKTRLYPKRICRTVVSKRGLI